MKMKQSVCGDVKARRFYNFSGIKDRSGHFSSKIIRIHSFVHWHNNLFKVFFIAIKHVPPGILAI
jgi:hypothetical protein